MRCPDYIILCVEDTMDWKHGTTREVVQKADPDLSRTVIVNTKLDTKLPQFGTPNDVADFVSASIVDRLSPHKLGGPFYTSVPSGRVRHQAAGKNSDDDYLFDDDEEFVAACAEKEDADRELVFGRIRRASEADLKRTMPRVGISRLRGFLERRVDECYRRNVAKIVPLLKAEYIAAERRLKACERELEAISLERLKDGADAFCDDFCKALKDSIQGSIVAPASSYGETLEQENLAAGSFAGKFQDLVCPVFAFPDPSNRSLTSVGLYNDRDRGMSHVGVGQDVGAPPPGRGRKHPAQAVRRFPVPPGPARVQPRHPLPPPPDHHRGRDRERRRNRRDARRRQLPEGGVRHRPREGPDLVRPAPRLAPAADLAHHGEVVSRERVHDKEEGGADVGELPVHTGRVLG